MTTAYELLGDNDQARDFELYHLSRAFYRRVQGDTELLRYFMAVMLRGNRKERASLPIGPSMDELEEKLAMTLAYVAGKPVPDGVSLDLTFHLERFNISPDHYWRTGYHLLAACGDRGYNLACTSFWATQWAAPGVASQIVRRYAEDARTQAAGR